MQEIATFTLHRKLTISSWVMDTFEFFSHTLKFLLFWQNFLLPSRTNPTECQWAILYCYEGMLRLSLTDRNQSHSMAQMVCGSCLEKSEAKTGNMNFNSFRKKCSYWWHVQIRSECAMCAVRLSLKDFPLSFWPKCEWLKILSLLSKTCIFA